MEVPGLGTFQTLYENASFDTNFGVFYPSRRRINYNSKYSEHSHALEDSLVRKLKIKEWEAKELIETFVSKVGEKLEKNNFCRLEGIGYLINNRGDLTLKDTFWKKKI